MDALASSTELLAIAVLFFIAGLAVPFRYGMKRVRQFGKYIADKLPRKEQ